MGWKTFDFLCLNEKCKEYNIKIERMIKDSEKDSQVCESCGNIMNLAFGANAIKTADNQGRVKI